MLTRKRANNENYTTPRDQGKGKEVTTTDEGVNKGKI
jgi:hypothetical protein